MCVCVCVCVCKADGLTLVVEPVNPVDAGALMISSEQKEVLRITYLVS